MPQLNKSRLRALEVLSTYKVLNSFAQSIEGIQTRTLYGLREHGLANYHPYADKGNGGWKITPAGQGRLYAYLQRS